MYIFNRVKKTSVIRSRHDRLEYLPPTFELEQIANGPNLIDHLLRNPLARPDLFRRRNLTEFADVVHTKALAFLFDYAYPSAHLAEDKNSQHVDYPKNCPNSTKIRRQPLVAERLSVGAAQGLVSAGTSPDQCRQREYGH